MYIRTHMPACTSTRSHTHPLMHACLHAQIEAMNELIWHW